MTGDAISPHADCPPRAHVLVFDSGLGGLSVVAALQAAATPARISYLADAAFFPYGRRSDAALVERVPRLIAAAVAALAPDAVVIACNTASTIALAAVRAATGVPVIGVVPAVKPAAALTRTGVIGLLGTPATVRRAYTDDLIARFAPHATVIRHGAADLAAAAETKLVSGAAPPGPIADAIDGLFRAPGGARMDVVVLACTHFPLVAQELAAAAPRPAVWIDSGAAIARRVREVLGLTGDGITALETAWATGPADRARDAAFSAFGFARGAPFPFDG